MGELRCICQEIHGFVQVMWENLVSRRFKLLGNNESAYHASGRMCQPSQAILIQTATPIEKSHMMLSQNGGWSKSSKIKCSLYGPTLFWETPKWSFPDLIFQLLAVDAPGPRHALLRLTPSLATQGKLDAACLATDNATSDSLGGSCPAREYPLKTDLQHLTTNWTWSYLVGPWLNFR